MAALNFTRPRSKLDSSQQMEFFSDFPVYDSFSVEPKSKPQSPDRSKHAIDEFTNYSSQLEEFPTSLLSLHKTLGDSKHIKEGRMNNSIYLSRTGDKRVLSERPSNIERSGPVPQKPTLRGVNEVKTETFHSPGRFLSPKYQSNKENQMPTLDLNKATQMVSDSEPTNRSSQNIPDTVRFSTRHYYPQASDSPLVSKIIKDRKNCDEDPPFVETCPSVESTFDIAEIMKLKEPLSGININLMRYLIDELAGQEKEFQPILQIDRDAQGKLPNRKYYMIFNYSNDMDEDEAVAVINGVKLQMEDILEKLSVSQEIKRETHRLKFYLIFGNSNGWLVNRQIYEISCNGKKVGVKSKKYNPSNLFFETKFREFENNVKKAILDVIAGPEGVEIHQLPDNANSFREKSVRFVISWDSGIAVLNYIFKKFLSLSRQELNRNFLLYFILERHLRTQKTLEAQELRESVATSNGESR